MFESKKCSLRPLILEDYIHLNRWNQDEETMKYLGGGFMPISLDIHKKWIENMIDSSGDSKSKRYMILNIVGDAVGLVGLYNINLRYRTCEIGIYIGEKEFRGCGIASDAVELIEEFAQKYLNMRKIKLFCVKDNKEAIYFWKKHAYKEVGYLKKERFINGRYCDLIIMEKFLI